MKEEEDIDIEIRKEDIRIDKMSEQGEGGKKVNKKDQDVRIKNIKKGIMVVKEEKQKKKKSEREMKIMRERIYEMERKKDERERQKERRRKVGQGERQERISKYNLKKGRVKENRINIKI